MKSGSLHDLKALAKQLGQKREQARQQADAAQKRRAQHQQNWFAHAVGPVQAIKQNNRVAHPVVDTPHPLPLQHLRDNAAVLHESLSDEFDVSTLINTDGHLSFCRPGVGPDVPIKLHRGQWAVQAELDLHGLRSDAAREALGRFLREARSAGLRCVRVVHGKGLGSPGRVPVLKNKVYSWLAQKSDVLAFVQAKSTDGGTGAVMVLLTSAKRRSNPVDLTDG